MQLIAGEGKMLAEEPLQVRVLQDDTGAADAIATMVQTPTDCAHNKLGLHSQVVVLVETLKMPRHVIPKQIISTINNMRR